jgi:hypothetical protein
VPEWLMGRFAKPYFVGSIPTVTSKIKKPAASAVGFFILEVTVRRSGRGERGKLRVMRGLATEGSLRRGRQKSRP